MASRRAAAAAAFPDDVQGFLESFHRVLTSGKLSGTVVRRQRPVGGGSSAVARGQPFSCRPPVGPPPAEINEVYEKRFPDVQKTYFERVGWPKDEEVEPLFGGGAACRSHPTPVGRAVPRTRCASLPACAVLRIWGFTPYLCCMPPPQTSSCQSCSAC